MASSSINLVFLSEKYQVACPIPLAAKNDKMVVRDEGTFVPEPEATEENLRVWGSTVIIPTNVDGLRKGFLGPYEFPPRTFDFKAFQALYPPEKILAFNNLVRADVVDTEKFIFRASPRLLKKTYLSWLEKVQSAKGEFWKSLGIFDLI